MRSGRAHKAVTSMQKETNQAKGKAKGRKSKKRRIEQKEANETNRGSKSTKKTKAKGVAQKIKAQRAESRQPSLNFLAPKKGPHGGPAGPPNKTHCFSPKNKRFSSFSALSLDPGTVDVASLRYQARKCNWALSKPDHPPFCALRKKDGPLCIRHFR